MVEVILFAFCNFEQQNFSDYGSQVISVDCKCHTRELEQNLNNKAAHITSA